MSDDNLDLNSMDFDAQMRQLAEADMQTIVKQSSASAPKPKPAFDKSELQLALGQVVRPLAQELESLTKSTSENNLLLVALGKKTAGQAAAVASTTGSLDAMSQQLQRLGSVETANQKLFDALHAELKGYKDNFLFETLQKPFIRELLPFFDDLTGLSAQIEKRRDTLRTREKEAVEAASVPAPAQPRRTRLIDLPGNLFSSNTPPPLPDPAASAASNKEEDGGEIDFLKNLAGNVENHLHHLVEILLRMDVMLVQTARGLPVDKKVHRTISFEPAPAPEDDNTVARSTKPGFFWKERMIRPEDIVAYRWRASDPEGKPAATPPPAPSVPLPAVPLEALTMLPPAQPPA